MKIRQLEKFVMNAMMNVVSKNTQILIFSLNKRNDIEYKAKKKETPQKLQKLPRFHGFLMELYGLLDG